MHVPDHLQRSRHGIWYYRWVVPKSARQTDPTLPTEIKRSAETADIRIARRIAHQLHRSLCETGTRIDMTKLPSGFAFRKFELELNAETGQITRLKANPDEMPAVMQTLEAARNIRTMMSDRIAGRLEAQPAEPATQTNSGSEPVATAAHVAMTSPSGIFLGEAFEKYSRTQIHSGLWSEE